MLVQNTNLRNIHVLANLHLTNPDFVKSAFLQTHILANSCLTNPHFDKTSHCRDPHFSNFLLILTLSLLKLSFKLKLMHNNKTNTLGLINPRYLFDYGLQLSPS